MNIINHKNVRKIAANAWVGILFLFLIEVWGQGENGYLFSAPSDTLASIQGRAGSDRRVSLKKRREEAVDYMRRMATILWTPERNLPYWVRSEEIAFKAGVTYAGIPYSQRNRETNLETFQSFLNENGVYTGPEDYVGSDCSSSVSSVWRLFDREIPFLSTGEMFPGNNGVCTVGDYKVTSFESTRQIIDDNGAEKMTACYDQLRPGDSLLKRISGKGHVVLVSQIDVSKKTVFIIEQTGVNQQGEFKGGNGTWRVDEPWSYEKLLQDGYIPITHEVFLNKK